MSAPTAAIVTLSTGSVGVFAAKWLFGVPGTPPQIIRADVDGFYADSEIPRMLRGR